MGSDSGLITYGKNYINTSVFLSCDEAHYKFSIDDNNSIRYVISYPRNKEWEETFMDALNDYETFLQKERTET